jgi:predicted transcriptional regulator
MVNRDRHDIVMEILDKARSGKKKTELMSEVGLSYTQSKQYFGTLVGLSLLKVEDNKNLITTNKGIEYLEKCGECFLCDWHKQRVTK